VKANLLDEAETHFKRALELDADLGAARLMLASLYMKRENWPSAVESLQTYLSDFPFAQDRPILKKMLENARAKAEESQD
jgi:predicted Zn-dependent protease